MKSVHMDAAGHRCSPATMPGYHRGRPPRDKGEPWLEIRHTLPIGALLCVIRGSSAGIAGKHPLRANSCTTPRLQRACADGSRPISSGTLTPSMAHEGVPLVVIQRQLGHANLGITSVYLQGIDSSELISTVHERPSPTISANAGLQITR